MIWWLWHSPLPLCHSNNTLFLPLLRRLLPHLQLLLALAVDDDDDDDDPSELSSKNQWREHTEISLDFSGHGASENLVIKKPQNMCIDQV